MPIPKNNNLNNIIIIIMRVQASSFQVDGGEFYVRAKILFQLIANTVRITSKVVI